MTHKSISKKVEFFGCIFVAKNIWHVLTDCNQKHWVVDLTAIMRAVSTKLYTWFYLVLGLFAIGFGYLAYDSPQYDGMIMGAVLFATGCALIWWSKRTNLAFANAISADAEHQAALDREEQIQIQAEAIARAENKKNN